MHPNSIALAQLEKETLETIGRIGKFSDLGEIYTDAQSYSPKIWVDGGQVNVHLAFVVEGGLREDKGRTKIPRRIDVSALVNSTKQGAKNITTHASYSVVLCNGDDPRTSKVLRKFHFDYEAAHARNADEPKPTTHLQICGKFSSHHISGLGYQPVQIDAWYPAFEKPRIPVQPTSLALLLNWIFLEFHSVPAITAILKDRQWSAMVRQAEQQILLPYFKDAAKFVALQENKWVNM